MKKRHLLLWAVFLLPLFIACHSEMDLPEMETVFYASIETSFQSPTKVFADEKLRVLWNADDRITIFNKYTFGYEYFFAGEDGDNAGIFRKVPESDYVVGNEVDHIYSVYPHSEKTKLSNDGSLTLNLPAAQYYKEYSFGIGANTMVSVTDDGQLRFRNVGGYFSFKLYGEGILVKSITMKGNNGEKIAGKAVVSMPVNGYPTVVMQSTATETLTLTCNTPVELNANADDYTEFWFVVPPTVFSEGFTVTVMDVFGGTYSKTTTKMFTLNRNTLQRMAVLKVSCDSPELLEVEAGIEQYNGEDYAW